MDFRYALLWAVVTLYIQFNIWWIIDMYFNRKEKHMRNILSVFAETIKTIGKKKEKE